MNIKGTKGELRLGGRIAVQLGDWTFSGGSKEWSLSAKVESKDTYLCDLDGPFELRLKIGKQRLRYNNVSVSIGEKELNVDGVSSPDFI